MTPPATATTGELELFGSLENAFAASDPRRARRRDFFNGWDRGVLQEAIDTCTSDSGVIEYCKVFDLYDPAHSCRKTPDVDEVVLGTLPSLPGCNPVTGFSNGYATPCSGSTTPQIFNQTAAYNGSAPPVGSNVTPDSPKVLTSYKEWTYQDCYADLINGRALPNGLSTANKTVEACLNACASKNYTYCGASRSSSGECRETDESRSRRSRVPRLVRIPVTSGGGLEADRHKCTHRRVLGSEQARDWIRPARGWLVWPRLQRQSPPVLRRNRRSRRRFLRTVYSTQHDICVVVVVVVSICDSILGLDLVHGLGYLCSCLRELDIVFSPCVDSRRNLYARDECFRIRVYELELGPFIDAVHYVLFLVAFCGVEYRSKLDDDHFWRGGISQPD